MNPTPTPNDGPEPSREQVISALFANLVIQQTNTALVLMGQVPNPETGEHLRDLEAAQLFIDQLEMLEVKTKGNLDKREEQLLRQSLTSLRMAFVEAVEVGDAQPKAAPSIPPPQGAPSPGTSPDDSAEGRKKFSKKY